MKANLLEALTQVQDGRAKTGRHAPCYHWFDIGDGSREESGL